MVDFKVVEVDFLFYCVSEQIYSGFSVLVVVLDVLIDVLNRLLFLKLYVFVSFLMRKKMLILFQVIYIEGDFLDCEVEEVIFNDVGYDDFGGCRKQFVQVNGLIRLYEVYLLIGVQI